MTNRSSKNQSRNICLKKADSNDLQDGSVISRVDFERLINEKIMAVERNIQAEIAAVHTRLDNITDMIRRLEQRILGFSNHGAVDG
jgi:hypothetical protein